MISNDSKKILAINIKYYRHEKNLSQEGLADSLKASLTYLNNLENSKRNPSLKTIDKIADYFNITTAQLLTYDKKHIINLSRIDQKKNFQ
ncbi:MAG: helix-turn-helix transcriptional regulator [Bacilli bacterium]|nr:helix-turn-helix transcriptional regulator [Bacilli bacterium]